MRMRRSSSSANVTPSAASRTGGPPDGSAFQRGGAGGGGGLLTSLRSSLRKMGQVTSLRVPLFRVLTHGSCCVAVYLTDILMFPLSGRDVKALIVDLCVSVKKEGKQTLRCSLLRGVRWTRVCAGT